ncbi:MAG: chorismate mutase [Chitinophagales bacterium]
MAVRGIRGATTAPANTPDAILTATRELLETLLAVNHLSVDDLCSAIFTATPDLTAEFPAAAARQLGWTTTPLLDAVEIDRPGALPGCIRVLLHVNTDLPQKAMRHAYLRGAAQLRPDLGGKSE